jgi:integrase
VAVVIKIKGIHKVKMTLANGSRETYYYAWRGGPRMKSKPGTPAFAVEHARLVEAAKKAEGEIKSLEDLILYFTGTDKKPNPDFISLAQSTQRDHLYAFRLFRDNWPQLPIKLTQQKGMKGDIREWHRDIARTNARKADKLLMSLSKIFSYGIKFEKIDTNPCTDIDKGYKGTRRDFLWSDEQIATFRTQAAPQFLLPFEMAVCTGQRQGDILRASPANYDGIYLSFLQRKGGVKLKVKVHARLKAMLDALPRDRLRICLNSRNRPWTGDGFQGSWRKELDRLGIEDVTFHDLRGTFITDRYREGSSVEDIALISGHSTEDVRAVLQKHYLSPDQGRSDAVISRMEKNDQ